MNNSAEAYGAAIMAITPSPTAPSPYVIVKDCLFFENHALHPPLSTEFGSGGVCSLSGEFENCTFNGNYAQSTLGGGAISGYSVICRDCRDCRDCRFAGNTAFGAGGAIRADSAGVVGALEIHNSILWNNAPDQLHETASTLTTASHSVIQGGFPGVNIIDAAPPCRRDLFPRRRCG